MQRKAKEMTSVDAIGASLGLKKASKRLTKREANITIDHLMERDSTSDNLKVILNGSRSMSQCI